MGTCRGRPGSDLSGPQFLNGEQSYKAALTNFLEMQLMIASWSQPPASQVERPLPGTGQALKASAAEASISLRTAP